MSSFYFFLQFSIKKKLKHVTYIQFFFTIQISPVKFKIKADNVVCHFSLLYRWLEEETRVIRNYIRDVINNLKKGFSPRAGYLPSTVVLPRYTEFPRTNTPPMGKKWKKTKDW
jgi:hypothetical protein